jgi:hypothetical protein
MDKGNSSTRWILIGGGIFVMAACVCAVAAGLLLFLSRSTLPQTFIPTPAGGGFTLPTDEAQIAEGQPTHTPNQPPTPTAVPFLKDDPREWTPTDAELGIPSYMVQTESKSYTNEEIAEQRENPGEYLALINGWGRIVSYANSYLNEDGCDDNRHRVIFTNIILFRTAEGAHEAFDYINEGKASQPDIFTIEPAEIGGEGVVSFSDSESDCAPPETLRYAEVLYIRYNVAVQLWVAGLEDEYSDEELQDFIMTIAQVIDDRLLEEAITD